MRMEHDEEVKPMALYRTQKLIQSAAGFTDTKSDKEFSRAYLATNENLAYFADLGVEDKDTLTVTGSGDHALNLIFFGAKSVETFDINQLTFLAFDLKKAAILHLTRNEFIDLYSSPILKPKLYEKIREYLKPQTRQVFDMITSKPNEYPSACFEEVEDSAYNIVVNNPYMCSKATYKQMQKRLQNLESPIINRHCPINKLDKIFAPKDVVILSNILSYSLRSAYANERNNLNTEEKKRELIRSLKNVLKEDGIMSLFYMYSYVMSERAALNQDYKIKTQTMRVHSESSPRSTFVLLSKKEDFPELE